MAKNIFKNISQKQGTTLAGTGQRFDLANIPIKPLAPPIYPDGVPTLNNIGLLQFGSGASSFHFDSQGLYLGSDTFASAPFRVTPAGVLTATGANISGTITATVGSIGGWSISANALYFDGTLDANSAGMAPADYPFYAGKKYADRATAPFRVTPAGALVASSATVTGSLTTGVGSSIDGQYLGNLTVATGALANLAVTAGKIANATITATQIANATITTTQISGTAAITGSQIASATIAGGNIASATITATNIANATITTTQISGTAAITGTQIASATITATNIANATITTTQISGTAAITGTQIASATITATNIANATITSTQISGTAGITGGQIANATITTTQISGTAGITGGQIANGTITTTQISGTAGIIGGQIASATIAGGNIAATTITASNITALTITAAQIANLTISSGKVNTALMSYNHNLVFSASSATVVAWATGTLTTSDGTSYTISAGNTGTMSAKTYVYLDTAVSVTVLQSTTTLGTAVGDGKMLIAVAQNNTTEAIFQVFNGIGGLNLAGSSIVTGSITANEIAATTITASQIAANTITAGQIAASTITANEIAASTITAAKMSVTQLSAISADLGAITAGSIVLPSGGFVRSGQTAYNTGTGFYLGNDSSTPRFSIGNPSESNMTWDGTNLSISGGPVGAVTTLGKLTTQTHITSTAAVDVYTLTIPANTMGATGIIRVNVWGVQGNGAGCGLLIMLDENKVAEFSLDNNGGKFKMVDEIANRNATNSQVAFPILWGGIAGTTTTLGTVYTYAVDTTAAKNLVVRVGATGTNKLIDIEYISIELIK